MKSMTVGPFLLSMAMVAGAGQAMGASCGSFASPTSCSVLVGGTNQFTVTGFNFVPLGTSGGGTAYQSGDVLIDISAGSGLSLLMSFSRNPAGPTPGASFAANSGELSSFGLQYLITLGGVGGTAAFSSPDNVSLVASSTSGTGQVSVQMILNPSGPSESCLAFRNSGGLTNGSCDLPAGLGSTLAVNQILTLSANTGNGSIGTFTNAIGSSFEASAGVPEPSTYALMGFGIMLLGLVKSRRRRS
jgi:hypothetical protein